jgi:hypothetical protein
MPTTRQELCNDFGIKTRAVKETMKAAFIDPNKLEIDESELTRFERARQLLAGPTSITYDQVRAVIAEEFGIKPGDTSEPKPKTELGETCILLGQQIADKIADNAILIASKLLPAAIERRLLDPTSSINIQVDRVAKNIYESAIDVDVILRDSLEYHRQEQLIIEAPEVRMLAS